jgi:hypothetical protein
MKKIKLNFQKIRFRKPHINLRGIRKGWIIFAAVSLALCLCAVGCAIGFRAAGGTLKSQKAAGRWSGESGLKYAQESLFLPSGSDLDKTKIMSFREKVREATADTTPKSVKNVMTDAWSTVGKATVSGGHGSSDASVIAVGGNYFYFHPLDLMSGSYFSDDDLMGDRVLLDEALAWKLYGGSNLAGLTVTVNGKPFVVAGVISREDDYADKAAYKGGAGIYMSFDAYSALLAAQAPQTPQTTQTTQTGTNGTASDSTGAAASSGTAAQGGSTAETPKASVSCYECVIPNPVSGFAANLVKTELNPDGAYAAVENSGRYSAGRIWQVIKGYGARTMKSDATIYPYWENAARLVENRCALLLAAELLLWICPAVFVCILVVKLFIYLKKQIRAKYLDLKDRYENRTLFHGMKGSDDDGGTDS